MDKVTRRQLKAARGGRVVKASELGEAPKAEETRGGRMRRLALAMVEARSKGEDLSRTEGLGPVLERQGLSWDEYWEIAEGPDWWPILAAAAISTSPGQYLEAFMGMAESAASGDGAARNAFLKEMRTVIDRGMGEEERYLQGLTDEAYQRELAGVTASCEALLAEMVAGNKVRREEAERLVEPNLSQVLEAQEKGEGLSADILFQDKSL